MAVLPVGLGVASHSMGRIPTAAAVNRAQSLMFAAAHLSNAADLLPTALSVDGGECFSSPSAIEDGDLAS